MALETLKIIDRVTLFGSYPDLDHTFHPACWPSLVMLPWHWWSFKNIKLQKLNNNIHVKRTISLQDSTVMIFYLHFLKFIVIFMFLPSCVRGLLGHGLEARVARATQRHIPLPILLLLVCLEYFQLNMLEDC